MTITLTPEQLTWIDARIRGGEFASIDETVRTLVAERIAERDAAVEDADTWALPYVEEGLRDVAEGRVMSFGEYRSRITGVLNSLKA